MEFIILHQTTRGFFTRTVIYQGRRKSWCKASVYTILHTSLDIFSTVAPPTLILYRLLFIQLMHN